MAQLRWSLASRQDLVEIGDFIGKGSALYAISVVERLLAAAESLQFSPFIGRVVPEYGREDLRELIVGSYRLVYLCAPTKLLWCEWFMEQGISAVRSGKSRGTRIEAGPSWTGRRLAPTPARGETT